MASGERPGEMVEFDAFTIAIIGGTAAAGVVAVWQTLIVSSAKRDNLYQMHHLPKHDLMNR